jgi:hypothetical protein
MRSNTGQPLLSEQSKEFIWAWLSGGPFTNRNEHPDGNDTSNNDMTVNQIML